MEKSPVLFRAGGLLGLFLLIGVSRAQALSLREYETPYYVIHTDLQGDDLREAKVRMTRMFETYRARTQGFAGQIDRRFEFYLYKNKEDYLRADGPPGSAGYFSGSVLMATAGGDLGKAWPVIQHEGFHQFARFVIRGDMPAWVDEGIAVYFQDSLFTGDTYYTGLIWPARLSRLRESLRRGRLKSFKELAAISHDQWSGKLVQENYDQAWSIVHYLVHGENGEYQKAFSAYIDALGKGERSAKAWQKAGLPELNALEPRWRKWVSALPADPTAAGYAEAYAQTFATYLARAAGQQQRFKSFEQFAKAGKAGTVRTAWGRNGGEADPWLPPRMLSEYLDAAEQSGVRWSITDTSWGYNVLADCPDGAHLVVKSDLKAANGRGR